MVVRGCRSQSYTRPVGAVAKPADPDGIHWRGPHPKKSFALCSGVDRLLRGRKGKATSQRRLGDAEPTGSRKDLRREAGFGREEACSFWELVSGSERIALLGCRLSLSSGPAEYDAARI